MLLPCILDPGSTLASPYSTASPEPRLQSPSPPPPPPRLLNLRGTFIIQLLSVIPYDCFIPADNEWYNFVYFAM